MPLGDPMGGDYEYGEESSLKKVWIASIPVSDLDSAVEFYSEVMGMTVVIDARESNWIELGSENDPGNVVLYVPADNARRRPGGHTGLVFRTESIYEVHKRLVDGGARFTLKPERQVWGGLIFSFLDPDGNEMTVMEDPDHYSRNWYENKGIDIAVTCFKDRTEAHREPPADVPRYSDSD